MAKWVHSDVLDNGLNNIKTNANSVKAILAYAAGDSFATVTAVANIIAEVAMVPGDYTLGTGAAANSRRLTTAAAKQDAAANNLGDPTHFAFVDTVNSKVLWVTDETGSQNVAAGNPVTFPSLTYDSNQPT
jgi:hypothetical protein